MSEMVERVANALMDSIDDPIDYRVMARAAIEAMREPNGLNGILEYTANGETQRVEIVNGFPKA